MRSSSRPPPPRRCLRHSPDRRTTSARPAGYRGRTAPPPLSHVSFVPWSFLLVLTVCRTQPFGCAGWGNSSLVSLPLLAPANASEGQQESSEGTTRPRRLCHSLGVQAREGQGRRVAGRGRRGLDARLVVPPDLVLLLGVLVLAGGAVATGGGGVVDGRRAAAGHRPVDG